MCGTLPNVVIDDNIVILDHTDANHDDSECDSDTLSIGPEAPPEIPSDKDIVTIDHTHANHDDSDGDSESDSYTLSFGLDAPLTFLLTTHYHLKKAHVMKLKHMKYR